jgi:AcrR family transcriptional regulator
VARPSSPSSVAPPVVSPVASRIGRPRSQAREEEILAAALEALVAEGYDAMTIEGVAARVGAGKATVYRRWRNKAELVVEAIRRHPGFDVPMVDTGDVRADLRTFLRAMADAFNGIDGALMTAFTAEQMRHPELAATFERQFVEDRRTHLRRIVQNAVDRGDLPANTDVELVAGVGPALLKHEFVYGRKFGPDLADRIVDQFLP